MGRFLDALKARPRQHLMQHRLSLVCVIVCAAVLSGCEAPGNPRLAAFISPGGTYEVRLSGRVTTAWIFQHMVRAEVYKNGALHLPARLIYTAGAFDTAFEDRFGEPEWLTPNALRFPPEGGAGGQQPEILKVRNFSSQPFRSIRIETGNEMFLIFDLPALADVTFPMAPAPEPDDPNWFDVLVDSGAGAPLIRGHGTFNPRPGRRPPLTFEVNVSAHGVEVSSTAEVLDKP